MKQIRSSFEKAPENIEKIIPKNCKHLEIDIPKEIKPTDIPLQLWGEHVHIDLKKRLYSVEQMYITVEWASTVKVSKNPLVISLH